MTSTRWHRTQCHGGGGADISGTVVHTKKGIMGSAMQRRGGGHREWFVSFSDREWIFCSWLFIYFCLRPRFVLFPNLPPTFSRFFLLRSLDVRPFPAPKESKLSLPRDLVRASSLLSAEACAERPGSGNLIYWTDGSASAQPTEKEDR